MLAPCLILGIRCYRETIAFRGKVSFQHTLSGARNAASANSAPFAAQGARQAIAIASVVDPGQNANPIPTHHGFLTKEPEMPKDTLIVTLMIVGIFIIFAVTLAWGELQTRRLRR